MPPAASDHQPRQQRRAERRAEDDGGAGAPLQIVVPARSLATIVATVTAAMCPVLPSATPARASAANAGATLQPRGEIGVKAGR